ncbi:MAG: hypothetical protein ACI9D0_000835 [Bacteroidia bacterium]|jgi:hypothetical protein
MTTPPHPSLEETFHSALPCAAGRLGAYGESANAKDEALVRRAQALLGAHQTAAAFSAPPLVESSSQVDAGPDKHVGPRTLLHEIDDLPRDADAATEHNTLDLPEQSGSLNRDELPF